MTTRPARRAGLASDPLGWGLALAGWLGAATFAATGAPGCGGGRRPVVAYGSPHNPTTEAAPVASCVDAPTWSEEPVRVEGRWVQSGRGVRVWAPVWLSGALLAEALAEVDSCASQPDAQGRPGLLGVPVSYEVVIQDPGAFSTPASPTGLARGMTDMSARIWVSFRMRPYETRPVLPALGHELLHVATNDPSAGH